MAHRGGLPTWAPTGRLAWHVGELARQHGSGWAGMPAWHAQPQPTKLSIVAMELFCPNDISVNSLWLNLQRKQCVLVLKQRVRLSIELNPLRPRWPWRTAKYSLFFKFRQSRVAESNHLCLYLVLFNLTCSFQKLT